MSDDFLQRLDQEQPRGPKKGGLRFNQAIDISRDEANQAAGGQRGRHGRKKQLTTRIPEEIYLDLMAEIKELADGLGMYQNDVQLWALMRGLEALKAGERPQLEEAVTKRALKLD